MTWQAAKAEFDRNGYVVLRGFFDAGTLAELREHIATHRAAVTADPTSEAAKYQVKGQPDTLKQLQLSGLGNAYWDAWLRDERLMRLAAALLDDAVLPQTLQWLDKPPRIGDETPPHQDGHYYMLEPNEAVALWVALDHATLENGCMRYVRGSHRRGLRPHVRTTTLGFSQGIADYAAADRREEEAAVAAPGDLIAHHSLTIHRADANRSERPRPALQFVYFAQRAREDIERKAAYQQQLNAELTKAEKI